MQYKANKRGRFAHWSHGRAPKKPKVAFEVSFEAGDIFEIPDEFPSKIIVENGYANERI